jgi:hypothetical protein
VDPAGDSEVVNLELALSDIEIVERRLEKLRKLSRTGDKESRNEIGIAERLLDDLHGGIYLRDREAASDEGELTADWQLLTAKPMIYIANYGEGQADDDPLRLAMRRKAESEDTRMVEISGRLEEELSQIGDLEERAVFRREMGLGDPGLEKLVKTGYNLLDLITFFTVVGEEMRAWTIPAGATAVEAAGKIHSDMAQGFVKAEVIGYEELLVAGDLHQAREEGLIRIEGRDYPVKDGDILHIRFHL